MSCVLYEKQSSSMVSTCLAKGELASYFVLQVLELLHSG